MKNKYRASRFNNKWFAQVFFASEKYWKYVTYRFMSGEFTFGDKPALDYSCQNKVDAEKFIKDELIPFYEPEIEHGNEINLVQITTQEKCMFDLMRKMLDAEKSGNLKLVKDYNDQLLKLHSESDIEEPKKTKLLDRLRSVFNIA